MRSIFSWLINILAIMFWIFRVIITIFESIKVDFIISPIDLNTEIALLFITLIAIILILKRNIIGGLAYFGVYGWYFGVELYNIVINAQTQILSNDMIVQAIVCISAILLGLLNVMDIALSKHRKSENAGKQTDWFYKNKKFDREMDERTDKNNYRIY